jgi:hypothetical protein
MLRSSVEIPQPFVDEFKRGASQRVERAAMVATDVAMRRALAQIRVEMRGKGLGNLGNALGLFSDLEKGQVFRRGGEAFSASAGIYLRNKSERTEGAMTAYTEGAEITPVRGRWLWIATDEIQRFVGGGKGRGRGKRITPALWKQNGLDSKIGPLVAIKGINGFPLLVVQNVGVSAAGKKNSVKGLTKAGRARKGQVERSMVVAFYAIPRTSRAQRVDLIQIASRWASIVPDLFNEEMQKGP